MRSLNYCNNKEIIFLLIGNLSLLFYIELFGLWSIIKKLDIRELTPRSMKMNLLYSFEGSSSFSSSTSYSLSLLVIFISFVISHLRQSELT